MRKAPLVSLLVGAAVCVTAAIPTMAIAQPSSGATATKTTSARSLLAHLAVRSEKHAGSYAPSKFSGWIDADGDGADTRTEVLEAESLRTVVRDGGGKVVTGRWVSPYDGVVTTSAARVVVDRLVPLKEAWVSGAASWTPVQREAFANDLGYGPALSVVSARSARAKGSKEPTGYLPAAAYRCAYVKNYIGVKFRWGLSVDPAELHVLTHVLSSSCGSLKVRKPSKPVIAALTGTAPKPIASSPAPDPVTPVVPVPVVTSAPVATPPPSVYYANCDAVRAAGKAPLHRGDPGYSRSLDRDGDGIACE